ncbi:MAG: hypothetical protein HQK89_06015 [Nitrospirae bacterium]|nr:hypothetical protein [Nitrospirota bacterium]
MKQSIIVLATIGIMVMAAIPVQARDVPFTQEDRDRIIRLEDGQKALNQRVDDLKADMNNLKAELKSDMNHRFDQLTNFMFWGLGILFGGMGLLITLVIWDRRTALAPAVRKTKELEEQAELLKKALKEVAMKDHHVKEALKHVGLL